MAQAWAEIAPAVQVAGSLASPLLTDMVWLQEISQFWNFHTDVPRIDGINCPLHIRCQPSRERRLVQFLEEVFCATLPEFEERKVMLLSPILISWKGNRKSLKLVQPAKCIPQFKIKISCSELRGEGILTYQFAMEETRNNIWEMWPEKAWNALEAESTLFPTQNPLFMSSSEIGLNILTWNCRGVLNPCFRKALQDIMRINNPEILILTETRLGGSRAADLAKSFPFDLLGEFGFCGRQT